MNELMTLLNVSLETAIIIKIIEYAVTWLFLASAITFGVKKGILAAENEKKIKYKSSKEDFKEEMEGWN